MKTKVLITFQKYFFPRYSNTPHGISFNTLKKEYSNKDTKIPNLKSALSK